GGGKEHQGTGKSADHSKRINSGKQPRYSSTGTAGHDNSCSRARWLAHADNSIADTHRAEKENPAEAG
ncbi:TPA: hypothetical protein ACYHGJ_002895, partial [Staphylococcus aureus]